MYRYSQLSREEQIALLLERIRKGLPGHVPPHFEHEERAAYILSGTCYRHAPILYCRERRLEWAQKLLSLIEDSNGTTHAWIVLPDHWHVLASIQLDVFRPKLGRLNNGTSTQFNREDTTPGRQVWYRFNDRRIRGERHFYAALNYIHTNAVKHGYVNKAADWEESSFKDYLEKLGRDAVLELWHAYPIKSFGRGWDD